jgi:hypothetical protein
MIVRRPIERRRSADDGAASKLATLVGVPPHGGNTVMAQSVLTISAAPPRPDFELVVDGCDEAGAHIDTRVEVHAGDVRALRAALGTLRLGTPRSFAWLRLFRRTSDSRWPSSEPDPAMLVAESLNVHTTCAPGHGSPPAEHGDLSARAQLYTLPADGADGYPGWMALDADWQPQPGQEDIRVCVYTGQGTDAPRRQCIPLADALGALEGFVRDGKLRSARFLWEACD